MISSRTTCLGSSSFEDNTVAQDYFFLSGVRSDKLYSSSTKRLNSMKIEISTLSDYSFNFANTNDLCIYDLLT